MTRDPIEEAGARRHEVALELARLFEDEGWEAVTTLRLAAQMLQDRLRRGEWPVYRPYREPPAEAVPTKASGLGRRPQLPKPKHAPPKPKRPKKLLTDEQAREVLRRARSGERTSDLAEAFGVPLNVISAIKHRRTYLHLDRPA